MAPVGGQAAEALCSTGPLGTIVFHIASRPAFPLDADSLLRIARSQLAGYQLPSQIRFVPDLPTNAGGKVMKARLRLLLEPVMDAR